MENPLVFVAHLGKCVFIEEVDAVHRIVQDMRGERHSVTVDQIQTEEPADPVGVIAGTFPADDPVAPTDTAHDQFTVAPYTDAVAMVAAAPAAAEASHPPELAKAIANVQAAEALGQLPEAADLALMRHHGVQ